MAYNKKSTRSVRSVRSGRMSILSSRVGKDFRDEEKGDGDVHSFDKMLVMAVNRLQCLYAVTVKKEIKSDYCKNFKQGNVNIKPKDMKLTEQTKIPDDVFSENLIKASSTHGVCLEPYPSKVVTVVYDNHNTLIEILIENEIEVPNSLLRIIRFLLPYYQHIKRITISNCSLHDMYIVYELSKTLNASAITEICLDGSASLGLDYSMLLETTKLRYLSLCRCNILDDACKSIAAKLHFMDSAQNLLLLNLSSNRITDEGAKHISNALRNNRHLRYLNLADNHITDCGVGHILDVLIEFPLTCNEIMDMRQRYFEYLRHRNELYENYLAHYCNTSFDEFSQLSRKSTTQKRRKTSLASTKSKANSRKEKKLPSPLDDDDYRKLKAEMQTAEILGPFDHPFHPKTVRHVNGYVYSFGNMSLAYLNLAYNDVSYVSVNKLLNVIRFQNIHRTSERGLLKVVLEGNNLPFVCPELNLIEELISKNIGLKKYSGKYPEKSVRTSRVEKLYK